MLRPVHRFLVIPEGNFQETGRWTRFSDDVNDNNGIGVATCAPKAHV